MEWNDKNTRYIVKKRAEGYKTRDIAMLLSRELGEDVTYWSVASRFKRINANKYATGSNVNEKISDNEDETVIESQGESILEQMQAINIKNEDEVMIAHGFDPNLYELVSVDNGVWQQGSKNGVRDLLKSRIKVKPRSVIGEQSLLTLVKKFTTPVKVEKTVKMGAKLNNLVIPLADIHFGITNYDMLEFKLQDVLSIMDKDYYNTIVIENLGDYFHSDKINSTETVSGTILDDVNMVSAIKDGMKFMSVLIEKALIQADNVIVKSIGGNHSFDNEYLFMNWVQERFPQAQVEITNAYRTAYMLDNVLIMLQHGDVAKRNVELLLATEYPKLWGLKASAEIHRGHLHNEKITDNHGVVVRQFGTPKKEDPYEIKNGWTGTRKELTVLEYNHDKLKAEYHI